MSELCPRQEFKGSKPSKSIGVAAKCTPSVFRTPYATLIIVSRFVTSLSQSPRPRNLKQNKKQTSVFHLVKMTANGDTELLTEHFGYPPVSLLDDIINSINILAERALTSIETGLLQQSPASLGFRRKPRPSKKSTRSKKKDPVQLSEVTPEVEPEEAARIEIENGTAQLETLLCASIDKNFDKFEIYVMRNILCIKPDDRDWIHLAHYQGLDFQAVGSEHTPTLESVNSLRRRLQASQRLHTHLVVEKARNDILIAQLRALIQGEQYLQPKDEKILIERAGIPASDSVLPRPFAFLDQKRAALASADATVPLETTSAFVLSQLAALRGLSRSLRNITPDLISLTTKEVQGHGSDAVPSWRRNRVEYIEGEMRKHLQHVRGIELGVDGSVRDGEWQEEGKSLEQGEVESLEKVVNALGVENKEGQKMRKNEEMKGKKDTEAMDTS